MSATCKSKAGGLVTMMVLLTLGGLSICFNPFAPEKVRSAEELTRVTMRRMTTALHRYRAFAGCYPSTGQGLRAFVAPPAKEPHPEYWEQMFREVPRDGWDREMRYELDSSSGFGSARPLLISAGEDGEFGTADDIASVSPGRAHDKTRIQKPGNPEHVNEEHENE